MEAGKQAWRSGERQEYPSHRLRPAPGSRSWLVLAVQVTSDFGRAVQLENLRRLGAWLAKNHHALPLFRPDGEPRSTLVCIAVPARDAEKALAFRTLCNELGLGRSLVQWRVGSGCLIPRNRLAEYSGRRQSAAQMN